ncbi:MAG: hypothetical protein ACR2M1_10535 [Gemmatimonadaceae bacterium]
MTTRIEWIGVTLPSHDEAVSFARISGQYNPYELATLEACSILLAARVRQDGSRQRVMEPKNCDGLSKSYMWGLQPASYVQTMTDGDARVVLSCRSGYEFRHEDDESVQPVVPADFLDDTLQRMILAAHHRQPFYSGEPAVYADAEGVLKRYESVRAEQADRQERLAWNAARR